MMALNDLLDLLANAKHPEDVFPFGGADEREHEAVIKARYRKLAAVAFSDHYTDKSEKAKAEEAFKLLTDWRKKAEAKAANGTYGDRTAIDVRISTGRKEYHLTERLEPGDLSNVYGGVLSGSTEPLLFKVTQDPRNNDLAAAEYETLNYLHGDNAPHGGLESVKLHTPKIVDSFEIVQGKDRQRVNVFRRFDPDYRSIAEILTHYPEGIDVRDAAWMFRRLLGAISALCANDVVHGAVVPSHFFVALKGRGEPETHNGILIDFNYAVRTGRTVRAVVSDYRSYYPSDLLDKLPADTGMDLYMAARLFMALTGGERKLPGPIAALMRACQLGYKKRIRDPVEVFERFTEVIRALYGKPEFREFRLG